MSDQVSSRGRCTGIATRRLQLLLLQLLLLLQVLLLQLLLLLLLLVLQLLLLLLQAVNAGCRRGVRQLIG